MTDWISMRLQWLHKIMMTNHFVYNRKMIFSFLHCCIWFSHISRLIEFYLRWVVARHMKTFTIEWIVLQKWNDNTVDRILITFFVDANITNHFFGTDFYSNLLCKASGGLVNFIELAHKIVFNINVNSSGKLYRLLVHVITLIVHSSVFLVETGWNCIRICMIILTNYNCHS